MTALDAILLGLTLGGAVLAVLAVLQARLVRGMRAARDAAYRLADSHARRVLVLEGELEAAQQVNLEAVNEAIQATCASWIDQTAELELLEVTRRQRVLDRDLAELRKLILHPPPPEAWPAILADRDARLRAELGAAGEPGIDARPAAVNIRERCTDS